MRTFLYTLLFLAIPFTSEARWEVKSEFQLQLTESLFDKVIEDFWQSMQGNRTTPIPNFSFNAMGIPVNVSGVQAEMNYAFPLPKRTSPTVREWNLASNNIGARITVNSATASTIIDRVVDGVRIPVRVFAECHNISLRLNPGMSSVSATVRADVLDGQVKLSMPAFNADWRQGAWAVESIQCSGSEGELTNVVRQKLLEQLSSFQNFDTQVREELAKQFEKWSKDASLLLLSQRELPTGKDYMQLMFEPKSAVENAAGLAIAGNLRFVYPYVAPGQEIVQEFKLSTKTKATTKTNATPELNLPFGTIKALMLGEYFAGKLEYAMKSYEIPAFHSFMQSRFKQFWAWPDLQNFATNTTFVFNFVPASPPAFTDEKAGGTDVITGNLSMPLWIRMFAPVGGTYMPYVEFSTSLEGPATMKLLKGGKIDFAVTTNQLPVSYRFAAAYQRLRNPNTHIAAQTMADTAKDSLSTDGLTLSIPNFVVGKSLKLVPEHWQLQSGGNLTLQFTTEAGSTAKATTASSKK